MNSQIRADGKKVWSISTADLNMAYNVFEALGLRDKSEVIFRSLNVLVMARMKGIALVEGESQGTDWLIGAVEFSNSIMPLCRKGKGYDYGMLKRVYGQYLEDKRKAEKQNGTEECIPNTEGSREGGSLESDGVVEESSSSSGSGRRECDVCDNSEVHYGWG